MQVNPFVEYITSLPFDERVATIQKLLRPLQSCEVTVRFNRSAPTWFGALANFHASLWRPTIEDMMGIVAGGNAPSEPAESIDSRPPTLFREIVQRRCRGELLANLTQSLPQLNEFLAMSSLAASEYANQAKRVGFRLQMTTLTEGGGFTEHRWLSTSLSAIHPSTCDFSPNYFV